jgi:hypothetical protein
MATTKNDNTLTRDFSQQEKIISALQRIDESLKVMATVPSVSLSHYRVLPDATKEAYEILQQGASLIHGSSTKYTLLGKIDTVEQTKISQDLMQGCELIATACLVLHEKHSGSSLSLRKHVIQACRAIVATTLHLVEAYTHGDVFTPEHKELGAQKTGAVWQTCSVILDKKLPMGNRNAMRRDLLTYVMECQETMDEFQELIDLGPSTSGTTSTPGEVGQNSNDKPDGDTFEAFLSGQNDQYSDSNEHALAQAILTLVKLSRGTIKLSLQALDAVGDELKESASSDEAKPSRAEQRARLQWIRSLHEECCAVGEGMTDLGTTLYPPLKVSDVTTQTKLMIARLETIINHVLDASIMIQEEDQIKTKESFSFELHIDVTTMAEKLKSALAKRTKEICSALSDVGSNLEDVC